MPLFNPPAGISLDKTAWVELAANGGSDATGAVGNPARPFATGTAAVAALVTTGGNKYRLHFGVGSHAGIVAHYSGTLGISGEGRDATSINGIVFENTGNPQYSGRTATIQDLGHKSITISNQIRCDGGSGPFVDGGMGGGLVLIGVYANAAVSANGGNGVAGENGTGAGSGGAVICSDSTMYGSIAANGGNGGNGSAGLGGMAGQGGTISLFNVNGTFDGSLAITINANGGNPGTGTDGDGAVADGGVLSAEYSTFNEVDLSGSGFPGTAFVVRFCQYSVITGDSGGGTRLANIAGGVFVP